MPMKRTVWDKHTGTTLEMWDIDAREACANDRRYSLSKPAGFGAAPPKPVVKPKGKEPAAPVVHDEAVATE